MRLYWGDPFFVSLFRRPSADEEASVIARGQRLGFNYDSPGASRDLVWPDDDDNRSRSKNQSRRRRTARALPLPPAAEADARDNGAWAVDRARIKVGYGRETYLQTRDLVRRWGPFQLPWAQVDPNTPTRPGSPSGVCVAARLLGGMVWTAVPLQVTVREEQRRWPVLMPEEGDSTSPTTMAKGRRFLLAHGCLRSHFLAGEERFSVEWRRDGGKKKGGGGRGRGSGFADNNDHDNGGPVYFEVATYSRPAHPLAALGYPVVRGLQAAFRRDAARHVARAAAVATVDRSTGGVEAAGPWWETEAGVPVYGVRRPGGVLGLIAGLVEGVGGGGAAAAAAEAKRDGVQRRRRRATASAAASSCPCCCCGS
jgi:uncharacterized protein (UPF0548 family)